VAVALVVAEIYLSSRVTSRLTIPFYNKLYPYVMFRPHENATYITGDTYAMSHYKKRGVHYTNEDGFRVSSADYGLPKQKPAGQLRIALLGGSAVQLGSTFEDTLPGSLKNFLHKSYPELDIEVVNAGIQSCVSRQSIAHLVFTVVDYHPDIVILYDGVNDIGLPLTYESRSNFPYNFHVMEESWELYRRERRAPLLDLLVDRSQLYRVIRRRFGEDVGNAETEAGQPRGKHKGSTAIPARRVSEDSSFVRDHIAEYLSNWRKLVELSTAYRYKPVCVLQPTAVLDPDYALKLTMDEFGLGEETALHWIEAFTLLYKEADRQIEQLEADYPEAVFLNLSDYLKPPEEHFWDLAHVYDETNVLLAERIHRDIGRWIESFPAWRPRPASVRE
jgi:hypothetical protein